MRRISPALCPLDAAPSATLEQVLLETIAKFGSAASALRRPRTRRCYRNPCWMPRYCISSGEHLPEAAWRAWKERTAIAIIDELRRSELWYRRS